MNHDHETETLSHAPGEEAELSAPAADDSEEAVAEDDSEEAVAEDDSEEAVAEDEVEEAVAEDEVEEAVAEDEVEEAVAEEPEYKDPQAAISEAEDPEAAARAALGLEEREDEVELLPEEAAAILAPREAETEVLEEEIVLEEPDLSSADLVDVIEEEAAFAEPSPYDRAGAWYVVHTYSGYEKKVKSNLESRVKSLHMEGRIHEVVIPMDDVIEFKGGKKTVVQKKVFPGYLLVRMDLDDETWGAVRNTPGVTGFVGSGAKPTPLSRKEVDSILRVRPEDAAKKARPRLEYEVGDQVRVTAGPFADFNGMIDEINVDQSTLKVLVNIFGRETPVTLDFADVAKL